MPHVHRFYIPPDRISPPEVALPPDEAHHALRVARLREDDPVRMFDGRGRELHGQLHQVGKRAAVVRVTDDRRAPEVSPRLTVLQAALDKEKAMDSVVRQLTDLGAAHIVFFHAERSQRLRDRRDRWHRTAVEACKQCGLLWLPDFVLAESLDDALGSAEGVLLAGMLDEPPVPLRKAVASAEAVTLAIGPEGDFSEAEIWALKEAGAVPISLGDTVFRAEVAAQLAAALVMYECGRLGPLGE